MSLRLASRIDQRGGRALADVADARHQLVLGAERAVEGDLRLVGGGQVGRRVDDAAIEGVQQRACADVGARAEIAQVRGSLAGSGSRPTQTRLPLGAVLVRAFRRRSWTWRT